MRRFSALLFVLGLAGCPQPAADTAVCPAGTQDTTLYSLVSNVGGVTYRCAECYDANLVRVYDCLSQAPSAVLEGGVHLNVTNTYCTAYLSVYDDTSCTNPINCVGFPPPPGCQ